MGKSIHFWSSILLLAGLAACTSSTPDPQASNPDEAQEVETDENPGSGTWQYKLVITTDFGSTFKNNEYSEKGNVIYSGRLEVLPTGAISLENGTIEVSGTFACPDSTNEPDNPTISGALSGTGSFKLQGQLIPPDEYKSFSELIDVPNPPLVNLDGKQVEQALIPIPQTIAAPNVEVSFDAGRCVKFAGNDTLIFAQSVATGLIPFLEKTTFFIELDTNNKFESTLQLKEDMDQVIGSATLCIDAASKCP